MLSAVTAVVVFSRVVLSGVDQLLVDGLKREKYRLSTVCVPVFCCHSTVALFKGSIATLATVLVMLLALAVPTSSTAVAAVCQAVPLKTLVYRLFVVEPLGGWTNATTA